MNSPLHAIVWIAAVSVYLMPTIVALTRRAPQRGWVALINVLFGWTVAGWIVALVMACRSSQSRIITEVHKANR